MESETPKGLNVENSTRQAIPPLRGYDYQVWQSLNRWISLGANEVLFLEVAEDFDVLRAGEAETVQIKDTSRTGAVTLNSKSITDAIEHFSDHQKNNPGYTVTLRLLTTSERGAERSKPFGGRRGLDYWDQCKRHNTDLAPLRLFLSSHKDLSSDLRDRIATSSEDELREDLIKRIEWDTGQKDKAHIEELVTQKTIYYGTHNLALSYSESVKVVSHLFKHVWSVIVQEENRRLTYGEFTRLFEEFSTFRISKRALQLRAESLSTMTGLDLGMAEGGQAFDLIAETTLELNALPSFDKFARRESLVADLQIKLNGRGIIALKGSSGMGKSTLASLITTKDKGKWRRLDLRDLKPEQIKGQLLYASLADSKRSGQADFVIDDLNFDDHPSTYERTLAGFIHTVTARGGRIIITTRGDMPGQILLGFDLTQDLVINVPQLTEEEIGQVALNYGCPHGKKLESWQRVIHGNTLGHPLLVHARIKNVATAGWPDPRIDDLFKPEGVESVRQEARRRLQDQLPSDHARTLAYRLSIFTSYFKRNHALHLAQHPPELSSSGEAFDLLVGPWVERLEHGYHRLSPLLAGSAQQMFSEEEVKNLHKTAAYAFLTQKTLTPTELSGVLLHGLVGEIGEPLLAVATAAFKIEEKDWPVISRELDWFALIALKPGEKLFKSEPFTSLMLRVIQFKIAAETDSSVKAPQVVASWEAELDTLDEYKELPFYLSLRMIGQFLFNHVLFRYEVPLPIKTVVNNIAKAITVDRECRAAAASGDVIMQKILRERPEATTDFDIYVFVAAARCKQADDVAEFLDTLDALDADTAQVFWAQLGKNESVAMNLISAAWLRALKEMSPNWPRILEVIERAAELALSRRADALFVHAYCAKAILIREYLPKPDSEAAVRVLAEGASKLGFDHPALQDYLAKVYMLDGRYHDALKVWRNIPVEPETVETSTRLFTYREALMCAGKLDDWILVAKYALIGEKVAHRLIEVGDIVAVGFLAEHSFALWKSGDLTNALLSLSRIIDALGTLPDTNSNIRAYALHVSVLHTIRWMEQSPEYNGNNVEPQPGDFTVPSVDEKVRSKPIPHYLFYWLYLARVEYKFELGSSISSRLEEEDRKLKIPAIRFQIEHLQLLHSLRNFELEGLVVRGSRYAKSVREFAIPQTGQMPLAGETQLVLSLLFAALVKLLGVQRLDEAPVDNWKADLAGNEILDSSIDDWLDSVVRCIHADAVDLLKIVKEPEQTAESRAVAALIASSKNSLKPEDLLASNSLLINAAIIYSLWRPEMEDVIERVISKAWLDVVDNQRFALLSPSRSAPEILGASRDTSASGLRKAARVLLAAQRAVIGVMPAQIIDKLVAMAQ